MKDQPATITSTTKQYCLVEYSYFNADRYEKRIHSDRQIRATSLTETGIRRYFDEEYQKWKGEKRWREGPDWFSFRWAYIVEIRIEKL